MGSRLPDAVQPSNGALETQLEQCFERALERALAKHARVLPERQWFNEAHAAEYCDTTTRAIGDARRRIELPASPAGKSFVFARADLDAWLATRRVTPKPAEPSNDWLAASVVATRAAAQRGRK